MEKKFDVSEEYARQRDEGNKNKYFLLGMAGMIIAAALDWELFLWIHRVIHPGH